MEKSATKRAAKREVTVEQWTEAYMEHVLLEGREPSSVFAFAKHLKTTEEAFYTHFNSFTGLERSLWAGWLAETIKTLHADSAYAEYNVREKMLAFYFTWLETLRSNRSFVLKRFWHADPKNFNPPFLGDLHEHFRQFIEDLLMEGKNTGEVAERPFVNQYEKAFWLHFLFITHFWAHDESKAFEKTDAAIEKSVRLAFDLVGKSALDSMLDFGKFLFQNRKG